MYDGGSAQREALNKKIKNELVEICNKLKFLGNPGFPIIVESPKAGNDSCRSQIFWNSLCGDVKSPDNIKSRKSANAVHVNHIDDLCKPAHGFIKLEKPTKPKPDRSYDPGWSKTQKIPYHPAKIGSPEPKSQVRQNLIKTLTKNPVNPQKKRVPETIQYSDDD